MFRQGIVGMSLALLTATPVLAQMGSPPASASNTGGTQGQAKVATGYGNPNGNGPGPANNANGACSSAGTPQSANCTAPVAANSAMQATQPPRNLLPTP
jgi:hypothetical protein